MWDFLEPKTKKFIEKLAALGGPPIYKLPVEDARNVLLEVQKGREKPSVAIEDLEVDTEKGLISVRIVRPPHAKEKLPIVLYFHGGGWILGDKETHDRLVRDIAVGANAAVVFVNYTPSPEARYPTAIEEAYAATAYFATQGGEHHLDPSRLAVAGDSVGGNMAIAVTLLAKERGGPKIDYQILFYPVTDAGMDTPSYQQFSKGPWLTKPAMEWFWNAYAPDLKVRKKHTVSPLHCTKEQLKELPPALIITDENDVLRDEGEAYAHKLGQAGVSVTAVRFLATHHDFVLLNPLADTPAARDAIALANLKLREVFR